MANEKRLIDANSLCESFEKAAYKCEYIDDMVFHLDYILDEITGADEVDAIPVVHGRWVMKETMIKSPFAKNAYCSVCLEETSYAHNYCPNCGAKMDGDGNG